MASVSSIAVVFGSNAGSSIPQSNFSGANYACIGVTCDTEAGTCTGGGTNSYTMRAAVANVQVGDPADGGVMGIVSGCTTSLSDPNCVIAPPSDDIPSFSNQSYFTGSYATTAQTSTSDGLGNATGLLDVYTSCLLNSDCALGQCRTQLSRPGGYPSTYFSEAFIPATNQMNPIRTNLSYTYTNLWVSSRNSTAESDARYKVDETQPGASSIEATQGYNVICVWNPSS